MGQAALQPATSLNVDRALQSALDGRRISREQAVLLIEHAETGDLLSAASSLRQKFKGKIVSYSRKVFIPLTHLCRDYCGYCAFRADPSPNRPAYMTPDEVLEIAERGARAGCKEALFSLGDQPERIFVEAREFLQRLGHSRTLDYLASLTELVLEKTGLLPHSNPGLMGAGDLARLRRSNVSLGLMLESTSVRLRQKGAAHWRAPDKAPALRLRTIEEAGRQKIPFTTGILIGIGETIRERVDSLFAIREMHERYGHIQEVLVQPFRAKENTRMVDRPNPSLVELQRTLAVARLTMPELNIQSPPNLVSDDFPELLAAGINDWGGISPVTQDFINPEAAWPQIRVLEERTGSYGLELRERLAIYPEYAKRSDFVDSTVVAGMRQHLENDFYARAHRT
jgi:7,8-didemethyl-8-hydroxy-5-deazariboflavin synthase CofG subunit